MAIPPLLQGQQLLQQAATQAQQGLAQQQGLVQQQYGVGAAAVSRTELHVISYISLQRDEVNNCYRCKVSVVQGCSPHQNDEVFVLYDGPFPITNEGIMEYLANFARERLMDEK